MKLIQCLRSIKLTVIMPWMLAAGCGYDLMFKRIDFNNENWSALAAHLWMQSAKTRSIPSNSRDDGILKAISRENTVRNNSSF